MDKRKFTFENLENTKFRFTNYVDRLVKKKEISALNQTILIIKMKT